MSLIYFMKQIKLPNTYDIIVWYHYQDREGAKRPLQTWTEPFEVEQSAISLPLLEAYDQRIRHLRAENEQLRAEKVEHVKIINGQATELAERRAEVFQLRQELQLLRHEVSQKKNTVKFNISRKSYWDVDRAARSLKRKKIGDYLRNAAKILPAEFKLIEVRIIAKFPW